MGTSKRRDEGKRFESRLGKEMTGAGRREGKTEPETAARGRGSFVRLIHKYDCMEAQPLRTPDINGNFAGLRGLPSLIHFLPLLTSPRLSLPAPKLSSTLFLSPLFRLYYRCTSLRLSLVGLVTAKLEDSTRLSDWLVESTPAFGNAEPSWSAVWRQAGREGRVGQKQRSAVGRHARERCWIMGRRGARRKLMRRSGDGTTRRCAGRRRKRGLRVSPLQSLAGETFTRGMAINARGGRRDAMAMAIPAKEARAPRL